MRIYVTAEHIRRGIRRYPGGCPVALALHEALPQWHWKVYQEALAFRPHAAVHTHSYCLSRAVQRRIAAYDSGLGMQPFAFNLKPRP